MLVSCPSLSKDRSVFKEVFFFFSPFMCPFMGISTVEISQERGNDFSAELF